VLIIDDEPRLARALASWLQDRHDVVVCDGGVAALDAIANDGPFDVVLCDLVMPGVTGMEVHSRARDRHPDQASRFVFMTGGAVPEGGIDGDLPVLRKPLDLDLLARLISQRVR
jgi:CheY-like chemotaxis protein